MTAPYILGINSVYHESSACLLRGSEMIAFAEEERFLRIKHAKPSDVDTADQLPHHSIHYCLAKAAIGGDQIDAVGYSFDPALRMSLVDEPTLPGDWGSAEGEKLFLEGLKRVPAVLDDLLGTELGERFIWVGHETAHAASAYYASPFRDAAVLSADGIGEGSTTLLAHGHNLDFEVIASAHYPDSIGFLWEKLSQFVGLGPYDAPKLMALAAFGDSKRFERQFEKFVNVDESGFHLDADVLRFRSGDFWPLEELFGPRRMNPEQINSRDADVAAALQATTERILIETARALAENTKSANLCLAGGVALNCVAMGRLAASDLFEQIFVQLLAHDAGTSLGAALWLWHQYFGGSERFVLDDPYFGPDFSAVEIEQAIADQQLRASKPENLCDVVAGLIANGEIVGWYQGAAEVGPRALGNRSILADPRLPGTKERINLHAKHREFFRPFAPSILCEHADSWFEYPNNSISTRFMSMAFPLRSERAANVPAVSHVDGTSRLQSVDSAINPRYYALISAFYERTGIPMVLNTSFNTYDEPIVLTPRDAVKTFLRTGLDHLVLGDWLVERPIG